jgi:hypothetical protein
MPPKPKAKPTTDTPETNDGPAVAASATADGLTEAQRKAADDLEQEIDRRIKVQRTARSRAVGAHRDALHRSIFSAPLGKVDDVVIEELRRRYAARGLDVQIDSGAAQDFEARDPNGRVVQDLQGRPSRVRIPANPQGATLKLPDLWERAS